MAKIKDNFHSFESSQYIYCIYVCKMNSYYSEKISEGRIKIVRMIRLDKRVFSSAKEFKNIKQHGVEILAEECYKEAKKYKKERDIVLNRFATNIKRIMKDLIK